MGASLRILFAATEVSPLAKVGGLADVAGSLPEALGRLGLEVRVAMPHYGSIDLAKHGPAAPVARYDVSVLGRTERIEVSQVAKEDGITVYLLGNRTYFNRSAVYGEKDDLERFLLFGTAISELPSRLGWVPDLLHCHDWHTGLAPALLKEKRAQMPRSSAAASVFTIHNLGYQGWFDDSFAGRAGLHRLLPPQSDPLRSKVYSIMGLAILAADAISTVSPTYAGEILTQEYGFGLEGVLQRRKDDLYGILNGIDYKEFNPSTDRYVPFHYDVKNLRDKAKNKAALQERVGLSKRADLPLAGMVGRLAEQKGLDLVAQGLERLLADTDIQFVLLGSGEEKYRAALDRLSTRYPAKIRLVESFNLELAQLIYAGCDLFLMPSRYEPCGLGQMIALRYGTVPVVRQTGGLADTIQDCSADLSRGNGFVFQEFRADRMVEAMRRADTEFHTRKVAWRKLMGRAMRSDFSWDVSARRYVDMYEKALGKVRGG